jgi:heptose I phosphotransferase
MALQSAERFHAKQGRSTGLLRFDTAAGPLGVYLKRHTRLPWPTRLGALLLPWKHYSPGAAEFANLARARALGVRVPEVVGAGESIGPWGRLSSFLLVAELAGSGELNVIVPRLRIERPAADFAHWKRGVVREMARLVARLHQAGCYHKDLYLCHFFHPSHPAKGQPIELTLIDLHRFSRHKFTTLHWRVKDLAQLLYSTMDVPGIDARDRLRFWRVYRDSAKPRFPRFLAALIRAKAARYHAHNRSPGRSA